MKNRKEKFRNPCSFDFSLKDVLVERYWIGLVIYTNSLTRLYEWRGTIVLVF